MEKRNGIRRKKKLKTLAIFLWIASLVFGYVHYSFEGYTPVAWVKDVEDFLWPIVYHLPGDSVKNLEASQHFSTWFAGRLFFLVSVSLNMAVFALWVQKRKPVRWMLWLMIAVFFLNAFLAAFGLLSTFDWGNYWMHKLFFFFANPMLPLFAWTFYRLSLRLG